jgi:TonB family protein
MLLIYQIKVGICLIAFYLLWKLLLSRETFHRFNRVALLAVMGAALVLPWIRFSLDAPTVVTESMVELEGLLVTPAGAAPSQQVVQSWNAVNVATVVYVIGLLAVVAWFLHSQWSLYRLMKKGRKESLPSGITLHVLPGEISPFSYFKHIVMSEQDYRDNPREILIHEQAHIALRHSWDVMFMGVVTLFQWWNPAAWLLCRELRQVHEYEADEAVINRGVDAKQYQLLLIRKSVGDQLFSMANSFNYQSLKKRIRMMTIKKSSQWKRLWALAVVPVIAFALLAFANPKTDAASTVGDKKVYETVEQMPQFPGGEAAMIDFLSKEVKYPEQAAKDKVEGRVIVQFVVEETGEIGEIRIARSVNEELDNEAIRVVKALPRFIPGRINGKAVAVWYTLPLVFKLQESGDESK